MNPYEYINFKKDDFKSNCIKENGFTEAQADEFFEVICNYIERLKNVRHSEKLSEVITDELLNNERKTLWIQTYWTESKYRFITHWLTKAVWIDTTYYYAKIRLGQDQNRKSGCQNYDIMSELLSDSDLFQILKAEANQVSLAQKFIIKNDDEMFKIFTICKEAINCEYLTFRDAIETADFRKFEITRLNITQDLTYRLSGKMGKDWYSLVCKTMDWKKTVCSGQGKKVESDVLIRKLRTILPRPSKE